MKSSRPTPCVGDFLYIFLICKTKPISRSSMWRREEKLKIKLCLTGQKELPINKV